MLPPVPGCPPVPQGRYGGMPAPSRRHAWHGLMDGLIEYAGLATDVMKDCVTKAGNTVKSEVKANARENLFSLPFFPKPPATLWFYSDISRCR